MSNSHWKSSSLVPLLVLLLAGCGSLGTPSSSPRPTAATAAAITASDLQRRVEILADDSLRGRETGTPGAESAARYLAGELSRLGLRPAGDGDSYYQSVPLVRRRVDAELTLAGAAGSRALTTQQAVPVSGVAGLPAASRDAGEGPLVYGGHLVDPEVGENELTLEQVSGAVVMVRLAPPEGVDPEGAMPRLPLAALFTPTSPAAAVLLIAEDDEVELWEYAAEVAANGVLQLRGQDQETVGSPFFLITRALAEEIVGGSLDEVRTPRTGLGTLSYVLRETSTPVTGWNLAAVLPGRDPRRAGEYVALGAHYDHVGVGAPVNGDSIYNGADDNASGTSALLEVAEQLAARPAEGRPARSIVFVWHAAEEAGLLGSEHFTDHPTVPREAIVAHVNVDMLGRNGADSLYVVGSRRISTELGRLVGDVNRAQTTPFALDYSYDAPDHPERVYCRSDHYNYARYGIPVAFFTTGLHPDYHKPSDEPGTLDYDKLARVSRFIGALTERLAALPARPAVDQPVPPLGTPCT